MILVFAVSCLLGLGYVALQPVSYKASAVISFQPRADDVGGRDLVALLVQRYPEVAASTDSVTQAAKSARVTPARVHEGLAAAIAPATLNLLLDVSLPTAEQAATATDAIYEHLLAQAAEDPNLQAVTVSSPSVSSTPSGAPKSLLFLAAILIAAVISILLEASIASRRPTSDVRLA